MLNPIIFKNRVRDPVHGFIHFSEQEKQVINWPEFQRLRCIKQLALTYYVYPGAMHTRFEHSLGVMELSTRIFNSLYAKNTELITKNFKEINLSVDEARQILRLASLFHDIGHLPFSHGGEAILPKGKKHEDVSIAIINALEDKIDSLFFSGVTQKVIQLIQKGNVIPQLNFIKNILSGSIDADRMDYLIRDSLHCGVGYGNFDYERLIETLLVTPGKTGGLDLAIDHGGIHSLEALILARYYMFTQIYYHRTRRIYDIYLQKFMKEWAPNFEPLTNVLYYDDICLINYLRQCAGDAEAPGYDCARKIRERKHHSVIYETPEFIDARIDRKARGVFEILSNRYKDYHFILDLNAKGTIHKFFVEGDEEAGEEFNVIHKQREGRLITDESHIIKKMPKKFHVIRIYVDPKSDEIVNKLRAESIDIEKEVR